MDNKIVQYVSILFSDVTQDSLGTYVKQSELTDALQNFQEAEALTTEGFLN